MIAGSPKTVGDYVRSYEATSALNYLVGAFQWGDITHEQAAHSLELFAREVGVERT